MRTSLTAVVAGLALLAGACGGTTTDRPSADAISSALQSKDLGAALGGGTASLDQAAADCFAKAVHDSRVSNRGLRAMLRGESSFSPLDLNALRAILPQLEKCKALIPSG
jgi:hypothetical protein